MKYYNFTIVFEGECGKAKGASAIVMGENYFDAKLKLVERYPTAIAIVEDDEQTKDSR